MEKVSVRDQAKALFPRIIRRREIAWPVIAFPHMPIKPFAKRVLGFLGLVPGRLECEVLHPDVFAPGEAIGPAIRHYLAQKIGKLVARWPADHPCRGSLQHRDRGCLISHSRDHRDRRCA